MHRFIQTAVPLLFATFATAAPCDIYAEGDTPCVAAHSTTRALYSAYNGALYQIKRGSDGTTTDISPSSAGGVANAAAQDSFCSGTTCSITIIYDQSGHNNHLSQAPPGGAASGDQPGGFDDLADANAAPVSLNGQKAYGVWISPGTGYRNDATNDIATGDASQGMYAIFDGNHYNGGCCFDYGNAETNNLDTGNGHMEAIYFGDSTIWGSGTGSGPWVMADLENGLFSGAGPKQNPETPSLSFRLVTAVVKGEPHQWATRGGNSQTGGLTTYYSGARPDGGYDPMSKEGAIILGIGGDNSISGQGTFYEGVMTSGYPSDDVENKVQDDIVASGYTIAPKNSGPSVTVGSCISLHVTTPGYSTRYLAHSGNTVSTEVVSSTSSEASRESASWIVRTGLGNSECYSFESRDTSGSFIRHNNFQLYVDASDGSKQFNEDATFCFQNGLNGQGSTIRAWGYPGRYLRHYNNLGYIASNGGPRTFDAQASFNDDVSFIVEGGLA